MVAEIAAVAEKSAGTRAREPTTTLGVYTSVFEQSLLIQENKRPWNFVASLGAELLVVSLALLIPLLYRDHLPQFHWKDIMVGPAPLAPPPVEPVATNNRSSTNATPSVAPRPLFRWDAGMAPHPVASGVELTTEAPPTLGIGIGGGGATNTIGTYLPNFVAGPPPPKPTAAVQKPPAAPVPMGGDVQMAKLVRKVIPEYPPIARSARISGVVRLIGTIGKDGTIQNLQVVSGHPMLTRAALEAVRQWIYKPTLLNGNAVEVIAPIEVTFTLAE
ncbi:MAG: TonB family protein [Bryobacteraceae bacterium]|jgi:protein TonB